MGGEYDARVDDGVGALNDKLRAAKTQKVGSAGVARLRGRLPREERSERNDCRPSHRLSTSMSKVLLTKRGKTGKGEQQYKATMPTSF